MIVGKGQEFFFETPIFYFQLVTCSYGRNGWIVILESDEISYIKERYSLNKDEQVFFLIESWMKRHFDINWRRLQFPPVNRKPSPRGKFTWLIQKPEDFLSFCFYWGKSLMKRITVNDAVEYLIEYITQNPECIQNHISLVNNIEAEEFKNVLWPALFNEDSWEYIKVDRARTKKEVEYDENKLKDVRHFENEAWYPRILRARVISGYDWEKEEEVFTGVEVDVGW